MLSLNSTIRSKEKKTGIVRQEEAIPAVLYGPATENTPVQVDKKQFAKTFAQAGESSLISLVVGEEKHAVFVHEIQRDPITGEIRHIDFYQPRLDRPIEVTVPLEFEGEPSAVKDLGGTFVKYLQEVDVRALPQSIPHEIRVSVDKLATFEDRILVQDLAHESDVEILQEPEEMVAAVVPPEDVESELAQPVEENLEGIESSKPEKKEEESDSPEEGENQ